MVGGGGWVLVVVVGGLLDFRISPNLFRFGHRFGRTLTIIIEEPH